LLLINKKYCEDEITLDVPKGAILNSRYINIESSSFIQFAIRSYDTIVVVNDLSHNC
jgi:hypothetical protein